MSTRKSVPWKPDWIQPPGDILREALAERGLTQEAAAEQMGVSQAYLSGIVRSRRAMTPRVGLRLERLTGISAGLWVGLWAQYQLALERQREKDAAA